MKLNLAQINWRKIALYYSAVLSIFMLIGGWRSARIAQEFVANILVLPIYLYIWSATWQMIKDKKQAKNNFSEDK